MEANPSPTRVNKPSPTRVNKATEAWTQNTPCQPVGGKHWAVLQEGHEREEVLGGYRLIAVEGGEHALATGHLGR